MITKTELLSALSTSEDSVEPFADLIEKIIVSGDHQGSEYSETEAMTEYLVNKGIPRDKIYRDGTS